MISTFKASYNLNVHLWFEDPPAVCKLMTNIRKSLSVALPQKLPKASARNIRCDDQKHQGNL